MIKRKLFYLLPQSWRPAVRRLYYLPIDLWDLLLGRRDAFTPPKGKNFVGSGDFKSEGELTMKYLIEWGGLKPSDRVLEVGSGIGRKAVPLMSFINDNGSYDGFDIVKDGIQWCKKKITTHRKNFNFIHADIYNDLYNKAGKIKSQEYIFPYKDAQFDFVFLTSVFTHMTDGEVLHYLSEIQRVLRPNGTLFITWFIWNELTELNEKDGVTDKNFPYSLGHYRLMDKAVEAANVAYNEEWLRKIYLQNNFAITEPIRYGWWRGIAKDNDYQDTIIAKKKTHH